MSESEIENDAANPEDNGQKSSVFALSGRLDAVSVPQWESEVLALADQSDVVLDLGEVAYMSSAGLRMILRLAKRLDERRESLRLVKVQPPVYQVLEMSGFLAFLTVEQAS